MLKPTYLRNQTIMRFFVLLIFQIFYVKILLITSA